MPSEEEKNVLGGSLEPCCFTPRTGFFRDGYCRTDCTDIGLHVICVQVTAEFLEFTKSHGNDLSTPHPGFPGLKPGDRWCVCAVRWQEAKQHGVAPPVILAASHIKALEIVTLEELMEHALEEPER